MAKFTSYTHAVKAGYGLPTNPPEEPDYPEFDQVPQEYWLSECCGEVVTRTKNDSLICNSCSKFCRVDEGKSIDSWIEEQDNEH